jgi:Zinc finger, C2H2 type
MQIYLMNNKYYLVISENKTLLRNHILRDQHSKDLYYCLHCGLGCKKFLTLHNHFQTVHSTQYSKQLYPCYKCKKTFAFNKLVFSHDCPERQTGAPNQSSAPSELHKCKGCDKAFSDDDELVCHSFTDCEARFKCSVPGCGKVFDHQRGISDHMREGHERQGNFICDQCGFSTNAARKLLVHKAKHNPKTAATLEIFRCQHLGCEATLKSKYALQTHMRVIHLNRQNYECHLCAKKFRCFSSIQNHMILNHMSSPENQRRFACNLCDMKFLHEKTQLKHLLSHRGQYHCYILYCYILYFINH